MGDEYPIKSDADADYLRTLARYVEDKIRSVSMGSRLPQPLKSEVLAAILLADEYFIEKQKNAEIERRLQRLVKVLEDNNDGKV